MRFQAYITEGKILNIIKNIFNKFSKMRPNDVEYQLKYGWYDLVERARKEGREKEMVVFINKTFHQHIRSLDDVNMRRIKVAQTEASVLTTFLSGLLDYESIKDMSDMVSNMYSLFTSSTNMEMVLYTIAVGVLALSVHYRHA